MKSLEIERDSLPRAEVLGVPVHLVTMASTLETIESFIRERTPRLVVTADASGIVLALKDRDWKALIARADLVTPDSSGVVWALRRKGYSVAGRVSGCDLAAELCRLGAEKGYRVYLLGASPGVAEKAAEELRTRYVGCQVVGSDDGYFTEAEEPGVVARIREANPDVLLVAMGMPKQEKWIDKHRLQLGVPVSIGVGGTLDVFAGVAKRAPRLVQRLNLEWLWRLAQNPRKIGKVMTLPTFALRILYGK